MPIVILCFMVFSLVSSGSSDQDYSVSIYSYLDLNDRWQMVIKNKTNGDDYRSSMNISYRF